MRDRLMRPIETYNRIWLAAIALIAITAVLATAVIVSNLDVGSTDYRAEFAQAASLRPGDQVTVAGIQVGTVKTLELAGDRVIVRFGLRDTVHLGSQSRVAIKLTTLLGSRYLEVSPASDGELHDRTVPLANTQVPFDLQQSLADATTTFEQIDADRIAQSLATLSKSLDGVPEALPQALDNLESLSGVLADRRDQIGSLLKNTDAVTAMIRDQQATLGSLLLHGRDLLAEVATRRAQVERLLASVTTLADKTRSILDSEPELNQLTDATRDLLRKISANDALLRNTLQIMPVAVRNLVNATGSATSVDGSFPSGPFVDTLMCALSGRAKQFHYPQYLQDCQPVPEAHPGSFPPAYEPAVGFPGFPPDSLEILPPGPEQTVPHIAAPTPDGELSPGPVPPSVSPAPQPNPGGPTP